MDNNNVLELEAKVADLEKRIRFLYGMIYKQTTINEKLIKNIGDLQDMLFEYTNTTNRNTQVLNILGGIIKDEKEG